MRFAFVALAVPAIATEEEEVAAANPIRKVVNMLETLKSKVETEGSKEKELYDKYMCYCKNAGGTLAKSIADAEAKGPQLNAGIEEASGKLAQLKEDVKAHQNDRAAAKSAMAEATALRGKEKAAFDKVESETKANLAALAKATTALSKGMGGFLQTSTAVVLRNLVSKLDMMDTDREDMLAFLSGSSSYAPASGEILGILKQMGDEMSKHLADAQAEEQTAVKSYEELIGAKTKEVNALSKMIEEKLTRIGDLGVEIQQMKNDLSDTAEGLGEDQKFLADLDKNCEVKTNLFKENVNYRSQELAALADTIKILNDDDALELFKKTLPGASSFVQIQISQKVWKARALNIIRGIKGNSDRRVQLDFISMALKGRKIGFDKVIKMIDDLVAELKQDQINDDSKKEYCAAEFDQADDKKKCWKKPYQIWKLQL